jgi:uncharacterized membrane protein YiaA
MHLLKQLLSDHNKISMVRIMSLASLITGIAIGLIGVITCTDLTGCAALAGVFVTSAFTGKVAQKFAEKGS